MAWKGESRRHSLARKGIKTAKGGTSDPSGRMKKPIAMENVHFSAMYDTEPRLFTDRGAIDGEPFIWVDFGQEDGEDWQQFVIVTNDDYYEVVDFNGKIRFRTKDMNKAINEMKELLIRQYEIDLINSPSGEMLGWVKDGDLTKDGKILHKEYARLIKASGKKVCDVTNPMNTRSNKELLFGHSLTHTKKYQQGVGIENAKCEHDRLVEIMKKRGMKHKSPFKSKLKASGKKIGYATALYNTYDSRDTAQRVATYLKNRYGWETSVRKLPNKDEFDVRYQFN